MKDLQKEFVPYELAVKLKALGFDEPCFGWYQDNTLRLDVNANQSIKFHEHLGRFKGCFIAPTFSQAFRWFRKKYHIIGYPIFKGGKTTQTAWYDYVIYSEIEWEVDNPNQQWKTYEEAELAGLSKLIEIVGRIKRLEASFQKELSELESHYLTFKSNLSHRGYSLRDKELLLQFFSAGNECGCMEHENIEDYFKQYYNETFKSE